MIPKVIHYTWFSGEDFPQDVEKCIASWKKEMPDYTFRLWDMKAIKHIDSVFLREALEVKKWAYAADFVRLYALYNEGGIYLDTDVMVFKSFDDFLSDKCFIGKEGSIRFENFGGVQYLTSHCMGSEKGHPFMKDCLEYYEDRHFIVSRIEHLPTLLRYNYVLLPYIQAVIALEYGYNWDPRKEDIQKCKDGVTIYPSDYLAGLPEIEMSYCQHLCLGSWREHFNKPLLSNRFYKIRILLGRILRKFLLKHSRVLMKVTAND